ncbi:MAG: endonuclease MutS2 [Synechococcus sp.]|nr:endonuclease MutS2 [Synechococcus sp.]
MEIQAETLTLLEWERLGDHLAGFAGSSLGAALCRRLPLAQGLAEAQRLLEETTELLALDGLIDGGLSLQGVAELSDTVQLCAKGGCAGGEPLLQLADTLAAARRLRRQVDDPELRPVTTALLEGLRTLPELEQQLRFALEDGGRVADRASPALEGLRRQLQSQRQERQSRLQELMRRWANQLQDTVIAQRHGRPVLAVKAGAAGQLPGQVHDSSASGNTLFIEPQAVVGLGNRIAELEGQERAEERRVLLRLSGAVGEEAEALLALQEILARLDLALARARYGAWIGAVKPQLGGDCWELRDLRHPLLVWQERRQGGSPVVPVSLRIEPPLRVVAITGPNTGGKTVTLKSLGLASLMVRAGLFLPCSGTPKLPWCGAVLADIGDEQSLQQNLSTFSGHVRRIARILAALDGLGQAPVPALVLLDEVGAGTDPSEGSALATALLKELANRVQLSVATTHFGELKALKYNDPRFENASVEFDEVSLRPTYRLLWGIPGRSNALAVARRLGLSEAVLQGAAGLLEEQGTSSVNSVISGLEEQRQRQQEAAEEAAALLMRAELLHEELQERWQREQLQQAERQGEARQQLVGSIREGRKEVRQLIRRLRKPDADGEAARQVGQRLRSLEQEHGPQQQRAQHRGWSPGVGDRVRLLSLGKAAEVLSISDDGRELSVRCGVMRLSVPLDGIEGLQGEKPAKPEPAPVRVQGKGKLSEAAVRTNRNTIDVRGMRVHEAESAVEEELRQARGPLWVIHGIGTGRLKRGLREWLQGLAYVERLSDAEQGDGGAGCTVVWPRG